MAGNTGEDAGLLEPATETAAGLPPHAREPIGYFLGIYPEFERTFITREVVALRRLGLNIRTASLRYPAGASIRTALEHDEAGKTFYVQEQGAPKILLDQARSLVSSPTTYLATLLYALRVAPGGLYWKTRYAIYFAEAVSLSLWARKNGIAYIHVHIADAQCAVAMLAKRFSGLRYSVTANGPAIFDNVSELRLTEKFTAAECVVCISDFCRSQVMRWVKPSLWERLVVVRHGIDPDKFAPSAREKPASDKVSILCVAILWAKKGHPILLKACRLLKDRSLDFECVIVGDGPERDSLEKMAAELDIRDCVQFAGAVSEDEIGVYFDAADLFVSCSLAEGIPNVLMESMSKELPVVAPNIMGIPELVDDSVHGILIPPANPVEMAEAIEKLARDPELRKRMGTEGRRRVVERYNLLTNTKELAAVMEEHLDRIRHSGPGRSGLRV